MPLSECCFVHSHLTDSRIGDPETRRFDVTEEQRVKLDQIIRSSSHILDPPFRLPSRHALTTYSKSFFGGFHLHMSVIHVPTWRLYDHPVEVIFGIAAVGAQYCFEKRAAEQIFFAGKAFLIDRLARPPGTLDSPSLLVMNSITPAFDQHRANGKNIDGECIETIRALLILMNNATWDPQPLGVRQSFALQELLTRILRNEGLDEAKEPVLPPGMDENANQYMDQQWRLWVEKESTRRTKLVAFFSSTRTASHTTSALPFVAMRLDFDCPARHCSGMHQMLYHGMLHEEQL